MKNNTCVLLVLFLSLTILSGCGGDKPTPPAVKAAQLPAAAEAAKKADPGKPTTASSPAGEAWPADFPAEVPKYEGGKLQRVSAPDPEKRKVSVLMTNTNTAEFVRYVQKLKDAGFVKTMEMDSPDSAIFSGKKDKLEVTATASKKANNVVLMSLIHK